MAGKARVHELAKELGVESKVVLAKLKEMGEFVKSASSTIEPPVARRLKEAFPSAGGAPTPGPRPGRRPTGGAPAPGPAARPGPPAAPGAGSGPDLGQPARPAQAPAPAAPATPAAPVAPAASGAPASAPTRPAAPGAPSGPRPGGPRPGPAAPAPAGGDGLGSTPGLPPRPAPRPGNNPFGVNQGATPGLPPRPPAPRPGAGGPRPGGPGAGGARPGGPGAGGPRPGPGGPRAGAPGAGGPRPGPGGPRPAPGPGGPRPNPGMMPGRPAPGGGAGRPGGGPGARPGGPGGRPGGGGGGFRGGPGGGGGGGGGGGAGRPGGGAGGGGFRGGPGGGGGPGAGAGGGFRGGPGGRPGGGGRGRGGGTAGAFGRGGGRGPVRGRKSKKQRRQEFDNMSAPSLGGVQVPRGNGDVVRLPRGASLSDFADRINANPAALVTVLFHLGEMVNATQSVSDETLQLLGSELGYTIQVVSPEDEDRELLDDFDLTFGENEGEEGDLVARPPVVTVMGHVDHGKTRLLDAIRRTQVMEAEAGGITQAIGAYQVVAHIDEDGVASERPITFIDTPGHEAFTAMRARGANVTDIVILVVAADDGVMPQTVEALNHAQAADVPIVVAVNKIDKEGANPAKIRQQLTEYGLVAEEYGGETMFVDVSAKQGLGIDELLEAVLLTADASLDLRANPVQDAQGVTIEAHLDRGRGPVATVLVQRGTLHVGDSIVSGDAFGRVRAMLDETGQQLAEAGPARPVQVLGFTSVPGAGDSFLVVDEDRVARQIAERRQARERNAQLAKSRRRISLDDLDRVLKEGQIEQLNLILKGDGSGSVEALEDALLKIEIGEGEEVSLRVIHRGVGGITEDDINLATASDAIVVGFNVRPVGRAKEAADREGVEIRYYTVIYQAIEEIEAALKGMLKPEFEEAQLGMAEVREVFRVPRIGNIAGCLVRSGEIRRNTKARLIRDGSVVADNLSVTSLKRFKEDATEVREGYECGIGLGSFNDIKIDDVIETFELREKPRG